MQHRMPSCVCTPPPPPPPLSTGVCVSSRLILGWLLTAEVLGAAALDYGFAGDYDYSLITAIVDDATFVGDVYDEEGGFNFPRAVPETAAVTTRTAGTLDDGDDRWAPKQGCNSVQTCSCCCCSRDAGLTRARQVRPRDCCLKHT